jgi:hypothetical protein
MTAPNQPGPAVPVVPADLVAAVRAAVNRVLIPIETRVQEWDVAFPQAMSGPVCTPLLQQQLAQLRMAVRRCREAGAAVHAATHALPISDGTAFLTVREVGSV